MFWFGFLELKIWKMEKENWAEEAWAGVYEAFGI